MSVEGTHGYKTFNAHAVMGRPFAGVRSPVNLQGFFSRVSLVADGTGKRFDVTVNGLVFLAVAL